MTLPRNIIRYLMNVPGWHTNRKILVIESDDWGSIRMPSRDVFERLVERGIRVDKFSFNRYDSLASEKDISLLCEVLSSVRDKNGNPAIITANTIVANPDFERIKASGFKEYFYEPFTETLKRYPEHGNTFGVMKKGIEERLLQPQFHGREHLNVTRWLKALRNDTGKVRLAFNYQMFDLSESLDITENSFMEALNLETIEELKFQKQSIIEGTQLFEKVFGFRATTFIAPCYTWSPKLNKTLYENGIKAFQGNWFQFEPIAGQRHKFRKIFHYTGQRNHLGQVYMVRNSSFEPSENQGANYVDSVLARIEHVFKCRKPAILGTHRLNYIGFIDPVNSEKNLLMLEQLLKKILIRWPDIEFISSDRLVELINSRNN
jgi:hypothetical protein